MEFRRCARVARDNSANKKNLDISYFDGQNQDLLDYRCIAMCLNMVRLIQDIAERGYDARLRKSPLNQCFRAGMI